LREERFSAAATELLEPAVKGGVGGGFDVEEFEAHADSGLDDTYHSEGLDGLVLASKGDPGARLHSERLAGADETAAQRYVRGDAVGAHAGFEVENLGIGGERITNGIAAVAETDLVRRAIGVSIIHDN
jgi:hypothetical protein